MTQQDTKICPICGEEINAKAKKCRFCGEWIEEYESETQDFQDVQETDEKIYSETSETEEYSIQNTKRCPYCLKEIPEKAEKCKYCGGWLDQKKYEDSDELPVEPKMPTPMSLLLNMLTSGFYSLYWIFAIRNSLNKLVKEDCDKIPLGLPVAQCCLVLFSILIYLPFYIFASLLKDTKDEGVLVGLFLVFVIVLILLLIISSVIYVLMLLYIYKSLVIIENYAYETKNETIKHNGFCWWFFNIYYLNFAINSFKERINSKY
ncbi:DUF4234 domain-containing protein [bacterium]|nr:DUF4234 domain-containing protein [bacterium]